MPHARRPPPARSWSVRSVFVRTRDGPDRLDLAYRRLLNAAPAGPEGRRRGADPVTEGEPPCAPPSTPVGV